MSLTSKALLGTLGVGTAGVTSAVGYKVLNKKEVAKEETPTLPKKKSIAALIESSGKTLLQKSLGGSNEDWKKVYEKYRTGDSSKDSNPWNIQGWDTKKTQENSDAPNDFMDACERESRKEVSGIEAPEYKNVLDWCTKDSAPSEA
ncbi:hypothetical protein HF1_12550 [Mycoplasma haemofelis str. Langford 1]|uniref:Uncharacterized protein n=1 Tax=Mycoplasma haemofelis (strain Langford 1) TaxID=941640 RepID=E8ZJE2_MYCHL|nr:hypothetical protein [Mycoplasma haemofelis]CBY93263.1 hypothetical protein HF1_12550 [Mycoplasma haemofelis str. Langford 1]